MVHKMKVIVELNGMAREVAGMSIIIVELQAGETYKDVVRALAEQKPELIDILIDKDKTSFLSSNMFIKNGDMSQPAMLMDESPKDGDHLTIISPITGG